MRGQRAHYKFLAEASSVLASSLDYEITLRTVAHLIVPHLGDWCAIHLVDDAGTVKELAVEHVDPAKIALARDLQERYPQDPDVDSGVPHVIRTGESLLMPEIPDELIVAAARDEEHLRLLRALEFRSVLIVPLVARGKTLGAITLVAAGTDRHYGEEDLTLAEQLAHLAALAIDNARLHQEMVQAQAELQEREERFRLLFAANPLPMWVYDRETLAFLEVNDAAVAQYGYGRDEFLGMRITDIRPPEDVPEVLADVARERRDLETRKAWRHRRKDGTILDVEISSQVIDFQHRRAVLVLAQDVTARNRLMAIELANRELERASQMKSEFLANMSHELRTPLNAIIGFSEILYDEHFGTLNDRQKRYITNVLGSGRHLLELVNDILDISKIEAGRMELHREEVAVGALVQEAIAAILPLAQKKGIALTVEGADADLVVHADKSRLTQNLNNLLANAIKFTPDGGNVEVVCAADANLASIAVRDTGIGIAAEDQQRVFREFEQIDTSHGRQQQGTGLGLTLTKRLIELHGGTIRLQSAVGAGSTFTVSLPRVVPAADREAGGNVVLIVEDDPASLELLQVYLAEAGYVTRCTERRDSALALARETRPAGIILDIVLQGGEAWDLLAQLKTDPITRAIPVVIVSILDEQQRGLALGASEYLVKPVVRRELLSVLQHVVENRAPRDGTAWRVLAVDDQIEALELIELALADTPFRLIRASSGAEALALLETLRPDIFLVDLVMEPLSGFDVIDAVLSTPSLRDLPIIVLTAKDLTAAEREHLAQSAVAVLPKIGFNKQRFLQELHRIAPAGRIAASNG
jgi:PAS domain S-box-containing protein